MTNPYANEWCFPRQAKHLTHGKILPMEQPSFLARLFGRTAPAGSSTCPRYRGGEGVGG